MAGTYSTDLTLIADGASGTPAEANAYSSSGSLASGDTDNAIQGLSAFVALTPTQANRGNSLLANNGTGLTLTAGQVVTLWGNFSVPGILTTFANAQPGGMVVLGTSTANISTYAVEGSDTYYEGGWRNYVIDPRNTPTGPENGGGTGNTTSNTNQYYGVAYYQSTGPNRASPFNLDGVRYGRMIMTCTGGTGTAVDNANPLSSSAGNFPQMSDYDDYNGGGTPSFGSAVDGGYHRFGQARFQNGAYVCQGIISLGSGATATYFDDSSRTVVFANNFLSYADFNRLEIRNASSTINLDSMSFSALGTVARGNFEMVDNATVNITGSSFLDMGTFIFQSNAVVDTTAFRRCDLITIGNATFTECTFSNSIATSTTSTSTLNNFDGCTFISDGSNHAVNLGTISANTEMSSNNTFTNYATTNGSTGNEAILVNVNTGVTLTINVSPGTSTPSVYNTGAGTVVFQQVVTFTIRNIISGTEIRLIEDEGGGVLTEIGGVENVAATPTGETTGFVVSSDELNSGKFKVVYSYSYTADRNAFLVAHHLEYRHIYDSYILGNTSETARINQISDRQYDFGSI